MSTPIIWYACVRYKQPKWNLINVRCEHVTCDMWTIFLAFKHPRRLWINMIWISVPSRAWKWLNFYQTFLENRYRIEATTAFYSNKWSFKGTITTNTILKNNYHWIQCSHHHRYQLRSTSHWFLLQKGLRQFFSYKF